MTEVKLDKKDLVEAYHKGNDTEKQLLERLYPKEFLNPYNATTFEQICRIAGEDPEEFKVHEYYKPIKKVGLYAMRLNLIQEVFNAGKGKLDWSNTNQKKYSCLFKVVKDEKAPRGFRLVCDDYGCDYVYTSSGARPYLLELKDAEHVYKTFTSEFEELLYNQSLQQWQRQKNQLSKE